MGQLVLDLRVPVQDLQASRYWEHAGRPGEWRPVVVRVRYGPGRGDRSVDLPLVTTKKAAPRNVLVERADGTAVVRPVRVLRTKAPVPPEDGGG
jgi:hypothetical protein